MTLSPQHLTAWKHQAPLNLCHSLVTVPRSPAAGKQMAQGTHALRGHGTPPLTNGLEEGLREAIPKAPRPLTALTFLLPLWPIAVVPTLGPWDLNLWWKSLAGFSPDCHRLASSCSSVSLQMPLLKEAFASPPCQCCLPSVTLSLTWFCFLHSTHLHSLFLCVLFSPLTTV